MENAHETSETQGSRGGEWLIFYSSNLPLYHREVVAMSTICDFDTELALWLGPSKQTIWGLGARGGAVMKGWPHCKKFPNDRGFRACWVVSVWLLQIKHVSHSSLCCFRDERSATVF